MIVLILGNGFTIDFLNHINQSHKILDKINVRNLFTFGSHVPWPPDGEPGFLSAKHCPNLWHLGARPSMTDDKANALLEDIITCVNVYATIHSNTTGVPRNENDIYIKAYQELSIYLKFLFIYYNNLTPDIPDTINQWPWSIYLDSIIKNTNIDSIIIITYNYDIWLERILFKLNLPFNIGIMKRMYNNIKTTIFKPHGSISFAHKTINDLSSFKINYGPELPDAPPKKFNVIYENLGYNYLVNAMIPPAGDSGRFGLEWATRIRDEIKTIARKTTEIDEVIICGLSYWHVDRAELDELLVEFHPKINIKLINPKVPSNLDAVLTSNFCNYIIYNSNSILEVLHR